jgi:hypothetical protein
MRQVTVMIPQDLLDRAMASTGTGLTPTIRQGLETVAARRAYSWLRSRKGKYRFSINMAEFRED